MPLTEQTGGYSFKPELLCLCTDSREHSVRTVQFPGRNVHTVVCFHADESSVLYYLALENLAAKLMNVL
jgi:hypothetical protein